MDFRIGDKVFITHNVEHDNVEFKRGDRGIVVDIRNYEITKYLEIAVEWEKQHSLFHDCGGKAKKRHGWRFYGSSLDCLKAIRKKGNIGGF